MAEAVPLLLGAVAASFATVALALSAVAWWGSDGRRLAGIERQLVTSIAAITARVGEVDSIVQRQRLEFSGLVEEAEIFFERAEAARKRAQQDRTRAERAVAKADPETETDAPVDLASLPRVEQLRVVAASMAKR